MTGEYLEASLSTKGSSGACSPCGSSSIDLRILVPALRRSIKTGEENDGVRDTGPRGRNESRDRALQCHRGLKILTCWERLPSCRAEIMASRSKWRFGSGSKFRAVNRSPQIRMQVLNTEVHLDIAV